MRGQTGAAQPAGRVPLRTRAVPDGYGSTRSCVAQLLANNSSGLVVAIVGNRGGSDHVLRLRSVPSSYGGERGAGAGEAFLVRALGFLY